MLINYLPILIFIIIGLLFGVVAIIASKVVAHFTKVNHPTSEKLLPYECGFGEFEDARMRFDVRYYLVAILFIVFDLEIAFLFPWSVVMTKIGWLGFGAMGVFLFLLVIGFIYEWKKGALEWE